MGHASPMRRGGLPRLETNEDHWLWWARCGYLNGNTTVEQYEQAVEDALSGRPVNFNGTPMQPDREQFGGRLG